MSTVDVVGLDGDDTLWHSEIHFTLTQERVRELCEPWADAATFDERLLATERRNLAVFGYGVKGFVISTIEAMIELSDGRVAASDLATVIELGRELLTHPVELCPHVAEVVPALAERYRLVVITKGDLLHQESKLASSGLVEHLDEVEIVAEKDVATYRRVLERHGIDPARFVMVGNSLRSDIEPVLALGARAVHVPYEHVWAHEAMTDDEVGAGFARVADLSELPALLASLESS
ncbi:MAG: HAD family hydrolase [Actinomycetota bacterium]|nr:HAD family hydrolase [Actinomycetota bacterium]